MTTPQQPARPCSLSECLSAEYEQAHAVRQARVLSELRRVVERVPATREFTNCRRYQRYGSLFALVAACLLGWGIHVGSSGLFVCAALMTAGFAVMTWQHRNAGTQPFMRLTRSQLAVDSLSAPIDLLDVIGIEVKDEGFIMQQQLILRADANLPSHRATLQLFGNQAMALQKPRPHIRILSTGLMYEGRKLQCDDVYVLLEAHCQAAQAQQELDRLLRQGSGAS